MTFEQILLFGLLGIIIVFFVWGRFRYDLVAMGGLLTAVLVGLVPSDTAFEGFSNEAVITVAAVLILSRGLEVSGAIDTLAAVLIPKVKSLSVQMAGLTGIGAVMSAIMNNVGALALLMPATINAARELKKSPSLFLMPLSFGSILGGLVTLIGTPPNIVIASYREDEFGAPFEMFDFTPVGLVVMVAGVIFLVTLGWRLLPKDRKAAPAPHEIFDVEGYLSEAKVPEGSGVIGQKVGELFDEARDENVQIAGIIRGKEKRLRLPKSLALRKGDILLLEATPDDLDKFVHDNSLELQGRPDTDKPILKNEDVSLLEAVISTDSRLIGRKLADMRLRSRYGLNILGLARQGKAMRERLRSIKLKPGDVLLFQAEADAAGDAMRRLGLLPLRERGLQIGRRTQAWLAAGLLVGSVALAASGLTSLTIALGIGALLTVGLGIVPLRELYTSIDWPVIVLIGAMIPIGSALETTGATDLLAGQILGLSGNAPAWVLLTLILVLTMTLSDIMNNVTTAIIMAPVSVTIAQTLSVNTDAFLMAVAVGASCSFLTPIGHKNNALIMGPGGYQFGDYWRMGLPLEVIVTLVGVPIILLVWGL